MIKIKRVYDSADKQDGYRVLVDRLWPRGLSKENVSVDLWLKEVAPSSTLRKWFDHDPEKWETFQAKYTAELRSNDEAVNRLRKVMREHRTITLIYGAKDKAHNQAIVLREFLLSQR
ncbi:MAG TPA: DUF488 domain-containing protein [Chryseosolibacter sp.]|nr:DUF488 domain-containing protein [Chryseosolibacter sp.]